MRISYTRVLQEMEYLSNVKDELRNVYQTIQVKTADTVAINEIHEEVFRHEKYDTCPQIYTGKCPELFKIMCILYCFES